LEECFINDEFGMDDLLSRISSEALRNFVIERGSSKEFSVNPDQLVSDGIKKVKQKRLEDQLAEIVIKLRTFNKSVPGAERKFSENTGIEELLAEKMHIDTELRRLKEDKQ
jgi:DNA primase